MRVAIIGLGVVGKAQARLFAGHDLITWDAAWGAPAPAHQIAGCEFAVVCVGTPAAEDGGADLGQVRAAFAALPPGLPALLRSTVPPGTSGSLAAGHGAPVAHAPEFLHERAGGAWRDSADVPWMLLGGDEDALAFFAPRLRQVFPGEIVTCTPVVAELAKYTANLHWATRVTFVNEMAAIAEAFGADWGSVRYAWLRDERVNPAYTAMAGLPPGFGGRCWPKDLSALIAASEDAGYKAAFLEAVAGANTRFRQ